MYDKNNIMITESKKRSTTKKRLMFTTMKKLWEKYGERHVEIH